MRALASALTSGAVGLGRVGEDVRAALAAPVLELLAAARMHQVAGLVVVAAREGVVELLDDLPAPAAVSVCGSSLPPHAGAPAPATSNAIISTARRMLTGRAGMRRTWPSARSTQAAPSPTVMSEMRPPTFTGAPTSLPDRGSRRVTVPASPATHTSPSPHLDAARPAGQA